MPRPLSAGQRRAQRAELQAEENALCDLFDNWRPPRQFNRVLPQPIGSDEATTEFTADIDFNPTVVLNERTAHKVNEFRGQKRCSRKHKRYTG